MPPLPPSPPHPASHGSPAAARRGELGLLDLLIMGVGGVVGTGVFILTGEAAARHAGPAVSLAFVLSGLCAALAGLCYAELAARLPVGGSAYSYIAAALGPHLAFLMGWDLILEYGLAAATVAVGWSGYAVGLFAQLTGIALPPLLTRAPLGLDPCSGQLRPTGALLNLPASCILLALTLVLRRGMRLSVRLLGGIVALKFAVIGSFLWLAAPAVRVAHWLPFVPANRGAFGDGGASGVLQAAATLFFTFAGFDALSTAASQCRQPQRDLPRAMLLSLLIAVTIYVAMAAVLTGVVPAAELGVADPLALALQRAGRPIGRLLVTGGAVAGLAAVMLMQLFGQAQILLAMATDGLLPRALAEIHPRWGTPVRLQTAVGLVAAAVAGLFPLEVLGNLSSAGTLLAFFGVAGAVILVRRQGPAPAGAFVVPGRGNLLPALATVLCGLLLLTCPAAALWRLLAWLALGQLVFRLGPGRQTAG